MMLGRALEVNNALPQRAWHGVCVDQTRIPSRPRHKNALALGRRILTAREQKGYTQAQLASIVGVTTGAIGQYEIGHSTPRFEKLERIALALRVSTSWLLTGDEPDETARAQTQTELKMLALIRELPGDQQALAERLLETLVQQSRKK